MSPEVLGALASVGVIPDAQGDVQLYHASPDADAIVAELRLLPNQPEDLAERILLRGMGNIYLSSSRSIGEDLANGPVVAVIVSSAIAAEVHREGYGDPPRVELLVQIPMDDELTLVHAERVD